MENKEKEGLSKKTIIIVSLVLVTIIAFLFHLQNETETIKKVPKEIYLVEQYQTHLDLFNEWSRLDKDTISSYNVKDFEILYRAELHSTLDNELAIIKYSGLNYSKTYGEIDRKLDIFFEVQGTLYFEYGFEFSPGGGYFYLPKSVNITDKEHKDLQQQLALLENFEKFWRTRK